MGVGVNQGSLHCRLVKFRCLKLMYVYQVKHSPVIGCELPLPGDFNWDHTKVRYPQPITGLYFTWYIKPRIFARRTRRCSVNLAMMARTSINIPKQRNESSPLRTKPLTLSNTQARGATDNLRRYRCPMRRAPHVPPPFLGRSCSYFRRCARARGSGIFYLYFFPNTHQLRFLLYVLTIRAKKKWRSDEPRNCRL